MGFSYQQVEGIGTAINNGYSYHGPKIGIVPAEANRRVWSVPYPLKRIHFHNSRYEGFLPYISIPTR